MRVLIRKTVAGVLAPKQRKLLKRLEFKFKKQLMSLTPSITRDDLRRILVSRLDLSEGDAVMVHAGLSLLNTRLSAEEIRDLVLEVIGPRGHLVVPTFPPVAAIDYMLDPAPFDPMNSRSGMGAISEAVRKTEGAWRSLHPTKSVAVIGPDAEEICAGHEDCVYPFGLGSPFERLLERDARIIGLGVPMSYLSFVHVAEDMHPERVRHQVWHSKVLRKACLDGTGERMVATRVHDMKTMVRADPEKFCQLHLAPEKFAVFRYRASPFFATSARNLHQCILRGFDEGFSIYD